MAVTTTSVGIADNTGTKQSFATLTDPAGLQRSVTSTDTPGVASYRCTANFTPFATAAVTMIQVKGSATKTVRVKRILVSGTSTALSASVFSIQRTTGTGAGGTAVTPTITKMDSGTVAASTAVVTHFTTAAQSSGAGATGLTNWLQFTATATTPTVAMVGPQVVFPEGSMSGNSLVLRGTADFIEIQNVSPANLGAGTVLAYTIEFEEDGS